MTNILSASDLAKALLLFGNEVRGKNLAVAGVTGHRRKDLPQREPLDLYTHIATVYKEALKGNPFEGLKPVGLLKVGQADGIDLGAGLAALQAGIPYACLIPVHGHEDWFKGVDRDVYEEVLKGATIAGYTFDGAPPTGPATSAALHHRNTRLVAGSDVIYASSKGKPGGTLHCVEHAKAQGVRIINLWMKIGH